MAPPSLFMALFVTSFPSRQVVLGIPLERKWHNGASQRGGPLPPSGPTQSTKPSSTIIIAGSLGVCCLVAAVVLIWQIRKRNASSASTGAVTQAEAILAGGTSTTNLVSNPEGDASRTRAEVNASSTNSDRPRRSRRPRRTPSQISTKSLPAYREEPADEDLVLIRRDMNDAEDEHNSPMLNLDSDPSSTHPSHTRSFSSSSSAIPIRTPNGHIRQPSSTSGELRGSMDSRIASADTHDSAGSDDRLLEPNDSTVPPICDGEEAPPYFEFQENQTPNPIANPPPEITISGSPTAPSNTSLSSFPFLRIFRRSPTHHGPVSGNGSLALTNESTTSSDGLTNSSPSPSRLDSQVSNSIHTTESSRSLQAHNRSGSSLAPAPRAVTIPAHLNLHYPLSTFPRHLHTLLPVLNFRFLKLVLLLNKLNFAAKEAYPNKQPPPFEESENDSGLSSSQRNPSTAASWWRNLTQLASGSSDPEVSTEHSPSSPLRSNGVPQFNVNEHRGTHEMTEFHPSSSSSPDRPSTPLPLTRGGTLSSVTSDPSRTSYTTARDELAIDQSQTHASTPTDPDA
ncbi:uncharacterized protein EI90DRAFT_3045595 [Cantharellus anzutake]|uniref:uncharacterized protein n=1 Tax=Cantharellus anzutake TaxID=1750568 RepID=UPI0019057207|nr:uncharacterized protein EI90DRAFT_3045595 [Cantharellus anzutake]KAF8336388.1 hypothetical protein EI90DRAFT_3045595 [Cantharellus anzutake]